jgi:hypothetical protein
MMVGVDAEHIALVRTPQYSLDIADPINAVGGDPGERHASQFRDHGDSQL